MRKIRHAIQQGTDNRHVFRQIRQNVTGIKLANNSAPTGIACGIVLYYMRAPVFPRVVIIASILL